MRIVRMNKRGSLVRVRVFRAFRQSVSCDPCPWLGVDKLAGLFDNGVSDGMTELVAVPHSSVCAVFAGLPPPPTPIIISALPVSLFLLLLFSIAKFFLKCENHAEKAS
jgi:hypothetical protein